MAKRSTTAAGGVVIALAVGIYLLVGSFFGGVGTPGSGGGDGEADSPSETVPANVQVSTEATTASESPAPMHQTSPEGESTTTSEPPEVVDVVIDDRAYFVREQVVGATQDRRIELAQLVDVAKTATGNEDGFRVRVLRKSSSRAATEHELEQALKSAGIPDNAVLWQSEAAE